MGSTLRVAASAHAGTEEYYFGPGWSLSGNELSGGGAAVTLTDAARDNLLSRQNEIQRPVVVVLV